MIPCSPQPELPLFETYYIQYSSTLATPLQRVLSSIQQTYATFRHFQLQQDLLKQISQHYQQIKLTKRKVTFAVTCPLALNQNPESLPQGSKVITVVDDLSGQKDDNTICICQQTNWQEVEVELVKRLQLDSVWVGLLYRIGTDIDQFQHYLVKHEHFQVFEVCLMRRFYALLNQGLKGGKAFQKKLLDECRYKTEEQLHQYNEHLQELVRSKFNRRVVIKDITMHPYVNLLESRSYFNLIFIEGQILQRFASFKQEMASSFEYIHQELSLQKFIFIDDYIYSHFIFGCLKKVKKYINRTLQQEPYSQIVKRHHRDIIKQFRPEIHQYFLSICLVLKERAACLKEAVGSIIVKQRTIISTGYNGTPMGTINCYNGGCQVCNNSEKMGTQVLSCRCLHAEYNCILTAGITVTPGATLYSSKIPCLWCAKLIIQGQIKEVICIRSNYPPLEHENIALVKKTLAAGKVLLRQLDIHYYD